MLPGGVQLHEQDERFTTAEAERALIAATGFAPGELSLGDLRNSAAKITGYYNSRGYPLAQAYVPAQDVSSGTVNIVVIEGRYGAIDVQNHSRLKDGHVRDVLRGLDSGDLVASAPLERRLLLLSDIPGVGRNMEKRLAALEDIEQAAKALYAQLNADQKKVANLWLLASIPTFTGAPTGTAGGGERRPEMRQGGEMRRRGGGGMGGMGSGRF